MTVLPTVYTADEAAQRLRCTASWLRDQAKARRIPFRRLSGQYRFTDDDLAAILALTAEPPKSAPAPPVRTSAPRRAKRRTTPAPPPSPDVRPLRPRRRTS